MSIAGFFAAVRDKILPPPTQHDLALKAMSYVANGAARARLYRAPKRNLHRGPVTEIGETEHHFSALKQSKMVKVKYQLMVDGSRYTFAHYMGGQHPGWLTGGRV